MNHPRMHTSGQGYERAGAAIGHPKTDLGHFCFPPESLRPEATYARNAKVQEPARGRKGRQDDRDGRRDCVVMMELVRRRPEVLATTLREMGVSESGDEVSENE